MGRQLTSKDRFQLAELSCTSTYVQANIPQVKPDLVAGHVTEAGPEKTHLSDGSSDGGRD